MTSFCLECKKMKEHAGDTHADNILFFSLMTGGLIYFSRLSRINIKSFYENKIGQKWSEEKLYDGFYLDEKSY